MSIKSKSMYRGECARPSKSHRWTDDGLEYKQLRADATTTKNKNHQPSSSTSRKKSMFFIGGIIKFSKYNHRASWTVSPLSFKHTHIAVQPGLVNNYDLGTITSAERRLS